MRAPRGSLLAIGLLAWVGCKALDDQGACTADFRFGLNITVVDSVTGAPPAQATLLATSPVAFADSVGPLTPFTSNGQSILILATAGERAGTYSVRIKSPGYIDWTRQDIVVTADQCHVQQVTLTARLQKP